MRDNLDMIIICILGLALTITSFLLFSDMSNKITILENKIIKLENSVSIINDRIIKLDEDEVYKVERR